MPFTSRLALRLVNGRRWFQFAAQAGVFRLSSFFLFFFFLFFSFFFLVIFGIAGGDTMGSGRGIFSQLLISDDFIKD
jgi:uncharacterized membrane protein